MTQLSGFAPNAKASLKLLFTFPCCSAVCSLALQYVRGRHEWHRNSKSPPVTPSPVSPDPVRHPMGMVAVALAVAGVLRPAAGPLVPPKSHRPMGEHRDALGDTPAGLGKKYKVRQRGQDIFFKGSFSDIAKVQGREKRRFQCRGCELEDGSRCLSNCISSEHVARNKLNSSELRGRNEWNRLHNNLYVTWTK